MCSVRVITKWSGVPGWKNTLKTEKYGRCFSTEEMEVYETRLASSGKSVLPGVRETQQTRGKMPLIEGKGEEPFLP
jgi:hypothetical protein